MSAKIFYRERLKVGKKEKKPRFRLVAVLNIDIDIYTDHLKKKELEQIAKETGAELILLKHAPNGDQNPDDAVKVK